jgi:hypothetical protein
MYGLYFEFLRKCAQFGCLDVLLLDASFPVYILQESPSSPGILAGQGKLDDTRVVAHFLTVNACRLDDFEMHRRRAFAQWQMRNNYEWRRDLGRYARLVPHDPIERP